VLFYLESVKLFLNDPLAAALELVALLDAQADKAVAATTSANKENPNLIVGLKLSI